MNIMKKQLVGIYLYILFYLLFVVSINSTPLRMTNTCSSCLFASKNCPQVCGLNVQQCKNLDKITQQRIKYIIQHPNTTYEMRKKINEILFCSYKGWASSKAIQYYYLYKQRCLHIKKDELILCALFGLYKGILRYNGNNTFISYVDLYVKHELQECNRKLLLINSMPKTYLRKTKTVEENNKLYNIYLKPIFIGNNNYIMENSEFNSIYSQENKYMNNENELNFQKKIWEQIRKLSPKQIEIMHYKYSYEFDVIRTNQEIANIMGCSKQNISKQLLHAKSKLILFLTNDYNNAI